MEQTVQTAGSTCTTVIQSAAKTKLNQSNSTMLRHCPLSADKTKEKEGFSINSTMYVQCCSLLCNKFQLKRFNSLTHHREHLQY